MSTIQHSSVNNINTSSAESLRILGVDVRLDLDLPDAVAALCDRAAQGERTDVAFVNADCLNQACKDNDYRQTLDAQDYVLPDGIGVKLAAKAWGRTPKDNVNGTDMLPLLCEALAKRQLSIYFLGAKPGVVDKMCDNLKAKFPELKIAGSHHGYLNAEDEDGLIEDINASGAHVLQVAFGAPRQEIWLHKHRDTLTVPVRMGVGGLFDFFSGNTPRAPLWMRKRGLEWAFRLGNDPARLFKRYVIGNPVFLFRVFGERLGLRSKT